MKENGVRMISEMLEIHGGEITEYVKNICKELKK